MSTEIIKPSNNNLFTEEEAQSIISKLVCKSYHDTLTCKIDGLTRYEIQRTENNEKKQAQYSISLSCHYGMHCESYTHTYSYVEAINFIRVFKEVEYTHIV